MQRDTTENQLGQASGGFNLLQDLVEETSFEQFIGLIRGETSDPIVKLCLNCDCENISGCLDDTHFGPNPEDDGLFDLNNSNNGNEATMFINNSVLNTLVAVDGEEEDDIGQESSATTTTTTSTKRKGDRSKSLISERRRRGRMKEKLYALRALVPNITKMDKASIVGDAAIYLQELQMQAKKLRAEIFGLESTLAGEDRHPKDIVENTKNIQFRNIINTALKYILQMDMFQVEERGFYVKVECNRGKGVAASLYRALESLTRLNVQSSNLATLAERFIVTFTLKVRDGEADFNLPNLKLWVTGALLNQGFEFQTQPYT